MTKDETMEHAERVLLEQLQGYLQHKSGCESLQCQKCGRWDDNHEHPRQTHDLVPGDCTCGLAALLCALPQTGQKDDTRVDEQTAQQSHGTAESQFIDRDSLIARVRTLQEQWRKEARRLSAEMRSDGALGWSRGSDVAAFVNRLHADDLDILLSLLDGPRQQPAIRTWHELKTWPEFFEEVIAGRKLFEIRENDRDFKVGDGLWLREYTVGVGFSGRDARCLITYLTDWKQQPRYVVLGLARLDGPRQQEPERK